MRMLRTILFATDFRPASQDAAEVVVHLSWVFNARVTLLHVLEPWAMQTGQEQTLREVQLEKLRELAGSLAAEKAEVAQVEIVFGAPADAIVRKAQELDADLIVIGAGEADRSTPFAPGPVAEAVLQHAAPPVLAVRPGEPALRFQKILCPVDLSAVSLRGLHNAIRLADAFGGSLIVLGVVPSSSLMLTVAESSVPIDSVFEHEENWKRDFERSVASLDFGKVPWELEVRQGVPHQEILKAAQEHQADVIVMGSTGRTGLARMLMGSVARRVLRQLPCSLLTVKQEDILEELLEDDIRMSKLLMAEGRALRDAGDLDTALTKFRQALARNPFHLSALDAQAEALEQLEQTEEAERCRRRAQAIRQGF